MFVLQSIKTPLLYFDQFVASTATEIGLARISVAKVLQFRTYVNPEILKLPLSILQSCFTAL